MLIFTMVFTMLFTGISFASLNSEWIIQELDVGDRVNHYPGEYSSLAIDNLGRPHISYLDNDTIKYAHQVNDNWVIEVIDDVIATGQTSIAIDSRNYPHVIYGYYSTTQGDTFLRYAYWNGSNWLKEDVSIIDPLRKYGHKSLALDVNNNPHIAYVSNYYLDFRYAYKGSNGWEIVVPNGNPGSAEAHCNYPSIAIDNNNNPYISYYGYNRGLRLATYSNGALVIENVDSEGDWCISSLAFDSLNRPHISYFNRDKEVLHTYKDGNGWIKSVVDSNGSWFFTSLAIDGNDKPHVAYSKYIPSSSTRDELKYAYQQTNAQWSREVVDNTLYSFGSNVGLGAYLSLKLDNIGTPYISYLHTGGTSNPWMLRIATKGQPAPVVPVTGVSLNHSQLNLTVGNQSTLIATVLPTNATNKSVNWYSSNPSVATVSSNGVVTALAAGTATITVTTVEGSFSASCTVNVSAPVIPVTGVRVNPITLFLHEGGPTATLTTTVEPSNATNKAVTWSSSNPSIATVNNGVVTPVGQGTATITVTTVDGGFSASCTVNVSALIIPVTGVSLDRNTLNLNVGGSTAALTANVTPSNATNKAVTWSSSNPSVATVNNGVVTPVGQGTATITVITVDGGFAASCTVNVTIVTTQPVLVIIDELIEVINDTPDSAFKNKNSQKPLTNMLAEVKKLINQGAYPEAIEQLNDIIKKTDGCYNQGSPDKNDWVLDCETQRILYNMLINIINQI